MKIGAVIQARLSSTRLPGKVLKKLPCGSGITVLQQVLRRLKKSEKVGEIIVATTTEMEDRAIVKAAEDEDIRWFRGSKEDVLSRYYLAAKEYGLDIVVRITGDCPCIDAGIIDRLIIYHLEAGNDYSSNILTRSFPHGLDAEVFSFAVLDKAFNEAKEEFEREHVTAFIYRSGRFKVHNMEAPESLRRPDIRITLDTQEDYALLCAVYDYLYPEDPFFSAEAIIKLFQEKPWLKMINEKVVQKRIFDSLEDELKEAEKILDIQDLKRARDYVHNRREAGQ